MTRSIRVELLMCLLFMSLGSSTLESVKTWPSYVRPLTLRRGALVCLLIIIFVAVGDVYDSISEIGAECSRSFNDRERVMGLSNQIACQWLSQRSLSGYCKAGSFVDMISDLLTVLTCVYGFIVLSVSVPVSRYVTYLTGLTVIKLLESAFAALHYYGKLGKRMFNDAKNPCYDNGLAQAVFKGPDESSSEAFDNASIDTIVAIACISLLWCLWLLHADLLTGGTGDGLIDNAQVAELIAIRPSLLVSPSFLGQPLVAAAAYTAALVTLLSGAQLVLNLVRLISWCTGSMRSEHAVCMIYSPLVTTEAVASFITGVLIVGYVLSSVRLRKLMRVFVVASLLLGLSLIIFLYGVHVSGTHYPSFLLQAMSADFKLAGLKGASLLLLSWLIYSMQMVKIAGGSCREPAGEAEKIVTDYFEANGGTCTPVGELVPEPEQVIEDGSAVRDSSSPPPPPQPDFAPLHEEEIEDPNVLEILGRQ